MKLTLKAGLTALALIFSAQAHSKGFADVIGHIPAELVDIVQNLSNPNAQPDVNLPKGIMIVGKPGTGKTSLFRALSEELPENSYAYISAINLAGPSLVDKLFDKAREIAEQNYHGKCVVMIDDFDSFGISNSTLLNQNNAPETVVALMNQLSGFKKNERLIVIVASHNISIHPDLGRSLKLDEVIELSMPDVHTRTTMLTAFLKKQKELARDVDIDKLAALTYDFSPADLMKLSIKANLLARQESCSAVTQKHLITALKGVLIAKGRFDKDIIIRIKALTNLLHGKKEPVGFERIMGTIPQPVRQLVEQLKNNSIFSQFKIMPSKGILFTGPPGTGKTTLARAISEEAQCAFVSISGAEFSQALVGGGKEVVKNLFKEAREKACNHPSGRAIIFIDEIDAIGKRSGGNATSGNDATINQLLTEMDGFTEDASITVIAATNHPENIDSALLRNGRFDNKIEIGVPDEGTRKKLVAFYLNGRPYNKRTVDIDKIAECTNNYTPADIKGAIEKAALLAVQEKASCIECTHIVEALKQGLIEKLVLGDESAQQMIDQLDVAFNGKASSKGFNQIIGGIPDAVKDMVSQMHEDATLAQQLDLELPRGYLFTGPPGTGKTLLAKAVAEEAGLPFIATSGSAFVEQYVGLGAKRVRDLFKNARDKAKGSKFGKTIIFVDEIDALGNRAAAGSQSEETLRTINAFLVEMDGISKDSSFIVIGATNNPQNVDAAIKSRLRTVIEIPLPDNAKRKALLEHACRKRTLKDVDFASLATRMNGFNAREIDQLAESAARKALHEKTPIITQAHFESALNEMLASKRNQNRSYLSGNTPENEAALTNIADIIKEFLASTQGDNDEK